MKSPPDEPLLRIEGLSIRLPPGAERSHAVEDVSLELARDEILCLVGESGSGKSMTALAVLGLLPSTVALDKGRILLEGQDLSACDARTLRALRGNRVAMIFQEPMTALNPVVRVGRQVEEHIMAHRTMPRSAARARAIELFAHVGLPDPSLIADAYPHRLSGGQRQRVMISMALSLEPAVLVADEPTTALDVTTQAQILALIRKLQAETRMGVVLVTHDFGVVAEVADRVTVMRHGRIVESGAAGEVLRNPRHPYTRELIAAVPRLGAARLEPASGEAILVLDSLRKTYRTGRGLFTAARTTHAVRDVSLTLRRGETLGLVGESGSGKSTLARAVVRLNEPDGGSIVFEGTDITHLSQSALRPIRRRIQMVFQDPFASLNPRHKVETILTAGARSFGESRTSAVERARALLRLVELDEASLGRYPHEFSGGQKQRIGLARALMLDPHLLVADEPVSALDVSVQAQVLNLLDETRRRLNLAMLFITHDLRVAAQICHRIAVMRAGEIVEIGPTQAVFADPKHPYTRELLDAVPGKAWLGGLDAPTTAQAAGKIA